MFGRLVPIRRVLLARRDAIQLGLRGRFELIERQRGAGWRGQIGAVVTPARDRQIRDFATRREAAIGVETIVDSAVNPRN